MVSAIECLQEHRIMHRDLKPHNLLLDDNYNIKFVNQHDIQLCLYKQIDFGDAKCIDEVEEVSSPKDETEENEN